MVEIRSWRMREPGNSMQFETRATPPPTSGEVLIRVVGCGVCHTDLGFLYDGTKTAKVPPLTLGHEISGIVEQAGPGAADWIGRAVIVPAVLPCGDCGPCRAGRVTICRRQIMPGNHADGGFASHIVVPARSLCPVSVADEYERFGNSGVTLRELSVVADAVTTPYQTLQRMTPIADDLVIVIGVGGIGGFAVQLARALGGVVLAIDIDPRRLALVREHGAEWVLDARDREAKDLRREIRQLVADRGLRDWGWKILECSGTSAGQSLAFGLLTHDATLGVVGFTMEPTVLRLSSLMAFDARAIGNWGCDPALYPAALALVEQGRVCLAPFVELHPLDEINVIFERAHRHELERRAVLVPALEDR